MKFFTVITYLFLVFSSFNTAQVNSISLSNHLGQVLSYHNSITEAYAAIPDSITHKYVIEILQSYNGSDEIYPINFTERKGANQNSTITLRPSAGNTEALISTNITSSPVISFNNCEYVIIDGRAGGTGNQCNLTIENQSSAGYSTKNIYVYASSHIEIKFITSIAYTQLVSSFSPVNIAMTSSSWSNNSSYNIIEHCKITGGAIGISIEAGNLDPDLNNEVRFCEISDFSSMGIFISEGNWLKIEDNFIYQKNTYNRINVFGIYALRPQSDSRFVRNKIFNLQGVRENAVIKGMYFYGAWGHRVEITNNLISLACDNPSAVKTFGIHIDGSSGWQFHRFRIYHNTVLIAGSDTVLSKDSVISACLYKDNGYGGFNINNNLLLNFRKGGNKTAIHTASFMRTPTDSDFYMDYNLFYAYGSPNSYHAGWKDTLFNNLIFYKAEAAPHEQHSTFKNIPVHSYDDPHLTQASWNDPALKAFYIYEVATDIDNEPRSFRYKGADELITFVSVEPFTGSNSPDEFLLAQNYPNPFNSSTVIEYSIKSKSPVLMELYDMKGEKIAVLINEIKEPGNYKYQFSSNLISAASGVYFYRLKSEGSIITRKMILLR